MDTDAMVKNKAEAEKTPEAGPGARSRKGRTSVHIYPDWCKGCGICAAFCPSKVFEMDGQGKARVVRESECVNCGFCELHCPDFAIKITPVNGDGVNGVVKSED